MRVYGLDPDLYSRLQPYIRIDSPYICPEGSGKPWRNQESAAFTDPWTIPKSGNPGKLPKSGNPGRMHRDSFEAGGKVQPYADRFELNGADSVQLVSVYGIGPVFARRIIRYRELLGGFYRKEQLLEVYALGRLQYDELCRRIFIDSTRIRKLHLDSLQAWDLSRHPYLDPYQAAALVSYRKARGGFNNPGEIHANRLLPDSVFEKILPYLEAGR
jgi:DNA uptake protein ComE-like DNA-binding protein